MLRDVGTGGRGLNGLNGSFAAPFRTLSSMISNRRQFLALLATAAVAPSRLGYSASRQRAAAHLLQMSASPLDLETPLEELTDYLTPNELFFVRNHWNSARVDSDRWTLAIDGEVERVLTLGLQDLKAFPKVDATCVLQCSGNGRY